MYLVTGAAGFIGFHTARRLLEQGSDVLGIDNLNPYYDVRLKEDRLRHLTSYDGFKFVAQGIEERTAMAALFERYRPEIVVHLAAQAGVRYSIDNPHAYVDANLVGFMNVLEGCRQSGVRHLVYASSSSVYGSNVKLPFSTADNVDHPVSLYAATKKANELMAHTYSHLYGLPTTGLRFFTVYGPWGRPDMAAFLFTKAILAGEPISVFNHGQMQRDFTYIDDIVEGIVRLTGCPPAPSPRGLDAEMPPNLSAAPYRIYNIGNHQPVALLRFIEILEDHLGKTAEKRLLPLQAGDVPATYADVADLEEQIGFHPATALEIGLGRFVEWYRAYYHV